MMILLIQSCFFFNNFFQVPEESDLG